MFVQGRSFATSRFLGLSISALVLAWLGCSSSGDPAVLPEWEVTLPPPPAPLPTAFRACAAVGADGPGRSALSPDGRDLAVATGSGQLILFDSGTGERKRTIWDLLGTLTTVVFSRRGDVLIAGNGQEVRAWSHPGGQPLLTVDRATVTNVDSVDLSPDQTLLATGGLDGAGLARVDLWSFPQGMRLSTLTVQVHGYSASPVLFSPEGQELLVGTRMFKVADLLKGDTPSDGRYSDTGGQGAFSPDGRYVASGGLVVERATGKVLFDEGGLAEAFWPDSSRYLLDRTLYHIDPFSFVKLQNLDDPVVRRAQFTPDGQRVLLDLGVAADDRVNGARFRFRRLPDLTLERTVSLGPVGDGVSVVSADGSRIASSLAVSTTEILYWVSEAASGKTVKTFRRPRSPLGYADPGLLGLSEDGALMVTENEVVDVASEAVRLTAPIRLLSPSGRLLVAHAPDGKGYVMHQLPSLARVPSRVPSNEEPVGISHDDRHVLTVPRASFREINVVPDRKTATMVDLTTGARSTLRGWVGDLGRAYFTLDGRHAVISTFKNGRQLLRLQERTVIPDLPNEDFALSPDGRHLAVASRGGIVRILRVDDFSPVVTLAGHGADPAVTPRQDLVRRVIWSRNNLIVSRGAEGTVRIWCVPPP